MASILQQYFAYDSYFSSSQSYKSESELHLTDVGKPMLSSPQSLGSTESELLCITWYNYLTLASESSGSSHSAPSFGSRGMMIFLTCRFNLIIYFSKEILDFLFLAHGQLTSAE